jgi:hypothetical protein
MYYSCGSLAVEAAAAWLLEGGGNILDAVLSQQLLRAAATPAGIPGSDEC